MAITASSKNFPRQLENASQYASGNPPASRIAETHSARRRETRSGSRFTLSRLRIARCHGAEPELFKSGTAGGTSDELQKGFRLCIVAGTFEQNCALLDCRIEISGNIPALAAFHRTGSSE